MLILIDIFYLIKCWIQFRMLAYFDETTQKYVTSKRQIRRNFLSKKLLLVYHLIMIIPWYFIPGDWLIIRIICLMEMSLVQDFLKNICRIVDSLDIGGIGDSLAHD